MTIAIEIEHIMSIRWTKQRAQNLRSVRSLRDLSQEKVSLLLEQQGIRVSRQYLNRMELGAGVKGVSPQILRGLCEALGVTLPEILCLNSEKNLYSEVDERNS